MESHYLRQLLNPDPYYIAISTTLKTKTNFQDGATNYYINCFLIDYC